MLEIQKNSSPLETSDGADIGEENENTSQIVLEEKYVYAAVGVIALGLIVTVIYLLISKHKTGEGKIKPNNTVNNFEADMIRRVETMKEKERKPVIYDQNAMNSDEEDEEDEEKETEENKQYPK